MTAMTAMTAKSCDSRSVKAHERLTVHRTLNDDHRDLIRLYRFPSRYGQIIAVFVAFELRRRDFRTLSPARAARPQRPSNRPAPSTTLAPTPTLVETLLAQPHPASERPVDADPLTARGRCARLVVAEAAARPRARHTGALRPRRIPAYAPEDAFDDRPVAWSTGGGYYTFGE